MSNLLVGPHALTPWMEQSTFCGIMGTTTTSNNTYNNSAPINKPKMAQVIQFVSAAAAPSTTITDLPFLRLTDGKTTMLAVLVTKIAQRSARNNTVVNAGDSQSQQQLADFDNTPAKGCLVVLHDWCISTLDLVNDRQPSNNNTNNINNKPVVLCLAIQGRIEIIGGHGIGTVQNLMDIHDTTKVLQAMLSIDRSTSKLHHNLKRQWPITQEEQRLQQQQQLIQQQQNNDNDRQQTQNNGNESSDSERFDDALEEQDDEEDDIPLGNVEKLFTTGQAGLTVFDSIVGGLEEEQEEEESYNEQTVCPKTKAALRQRITNEPDQQRRSKRPRQQQQQQQQQQSQVEEPEVYEVEPAPTPPNAFSVYDAKTGQIAYHVTDRAQMQQLFANVLDSFEKQQQQEQKQQEQGAGVVAVAVAAEGVAATVTTNNNNTSTTKDKPPQQTGDTAAAAAAAVVTTAGNDKRLPIRNPYKKQPPKSPIPTMRNEHLEHIEKTPSPMTQQQQGGSGGGDIGSGDFTQHKGITNMLCSDDSDSDGDDDDDDNNNDNDDDNGEKLQGEANNATTNAGDGGDDDDDDDDPAQQQPAAVTVVSAERRLKSYMGQFLRRVDYALDAGARTRRQKSIAATTAAAATGHKRRMPGDRIRAWVQG